jgi:hypothetical protein
MKRKRSLAQRRMSGSETRAEKVDSGPVLKSSGFLREPGRRKFLAQLGSGYTFRVDLLLPQLIDPGSLGKAARATGLHVALAGTISDVTPYSSCS